jgi:DNA-binding CsgD family transcriptional regulator
VEPLEISIHSALMDELMSSPDLLGTWECMRRLGSPVSATSLAGVTRLTPTDAQRWISRLVELGIAESLPARGRHRQVRYQLLHHGVRALCEFPRDRARVQETIRKVAGHVESCMGTTPFDAPSKPNQWHGVFATLMHVNDEEVSELRKRLQHVAQYVSMLADRKPASDGDPDGLLCNYGFTFRVEPLPMPAMPTILIHFVRQDSPMHHEAQEMVQSAAPSKLSKREYEVALALARGKTIAETAEELGVSAGTVHTLSRRLYRKLGIKRRAELVNAMAHGSGGTG